MLSYGYRSKNSAGNNDPNSSNGGSENRQLTEYTRRGNGNTRGIVGNARLFRPLPGEEIDASTTSHDMPAKWPVSTVTDVESLEMADRVHTLLPSIGIKLENRST